MGDTDPTARGWGTPKAGRTWGGQWGCSTAPKMGVSEETWGQEGVCWCWGASGYPKAGEIWGCQEVWELVGTSERDNKGVGETPEWEREGLWRCGGAPKLGPLGGASVYPKGGGKRDHGAP